VKSGPASRRGLAAQLPRQGGHEPTTDERGLADAVAGAVAGADEVKGLEVDRIEIEIEVHIAPPADRAINRLTRPEAAREWARAELDGDADAPPPLERLPGAMFGGSAPSSWAMLAAPTRRQPPEGLHPEFGVLRGSPCGRPRCGAGDWHSGPIRRNAC